MMQKVVIAISIIFFISSGLAHSQNKSYNESAYELINEVISNKDPNSYLSKEVLPVNWEKYLEVNYLNNNNSGVDKFFEPIHLELSVEDLEFMKTIAVEKKIKRWKKKYIKGIRLIRKNKRIDYSEHSKYKISQPVFNEDLSYSIIVEEYIGGMENASSFIRIYKKIEDSWKEIAFVELWVS
ncbi:hypothetical protein [uncultured Draconibacterium sp.]|uniref:hypothetical protein n=1 Tax=uncultured Draconibacterium sp. TaxID=1573823 RepID=UPI0025FAB468|nr:hypothetical protein [uncultured Draconibacterium sp.]